MFKAVKQLGTGTTTYSIKAYGGDRFDRVKERYETGGEAVWEASTWR